MDQEKAEHVGGEADSLSVAPVVSHSRDQQDEPVAPETEEAMPPSAALEPANPESSLRATQASASAATAEPIAVQATNAGMEKIDGAEIEAVKVTAVTVEAAKPEVVNAEAAKADAVSEPSEPGKTGAAESGGKLILLPPRDRGQTGEAAGSQNTESPRMFAKRRIAAVVAMVALAILAGGLGGALATAALTRAGVAVASSNHAPENHAIEAWVARIDADMVALKASLENNARLGMTQFSRTSDRLDRIEKAQAEPVAKLATLNEAGEKLQAAPVSLPPPTPIVASATTTAAKDVTGSVPPPPAPKTEVGRLPTVEGWVLRDVAYGGALIESRRGIYEVYAGDPVPGLGRVDAIRRQDGRWVVVTSRGLIVAR